MGHEIEIKFKGKPKGAIVCELNKILYCVCSVIKIVASNGIEVKLKNGKLRGEMLELVTGEGDYYSFKGIPYAQPPIGPLRFKVWC